MVPRAFRAGALLKARGVLLTLGLSLCFVVAWLSSLAGLAPIVGAFAAGLVLEEAHFTEYKGRGELSMDQRFSRSPISSCRYSSS